LGDGSGAAEKRRAYSAGDAMYASAGARSAGFNRETEAFSPMARRSRCWPCSSGATKKLAGQAA
jgi:hypothetical protein